MTIDTPTSRMVAVNNTRSDLSLRAMVPYKAEPNFARNIAWPADYDVMSDQQSSVGLGRRHQLHRPGQSVFPAASPSPHQPTDDCSSLNRATSSLNLRPRS